MRGFGVRPEDQTFFRKRITPFLEFGTFAVIVYRFGSWAYTVKIPVIRQILITLYLFINVFCMAVTGIHIARENKIGPGLVIHNFSGILVLAKEIGHSCTLNQGASIMNVRGVGSCHDRKQLLLRSRLQSRGRGNHWRQRRGERELRRYYVTYRVEPPSSVSRHASFHAKLPVLILRIPSAGSLQRLRQQLLRDQRRTLIIGTRTDGYSVAMVAACPFPANHGSAASIREMSDTLVDMGHDVHIVTYPIGQEDIRVRRAKVHRTASFRPEGNAKVGPSADKFFLDFQLLRLLCRVIRRERIDIIHAHNYEGALVGIMAKWLTRRPLLYNAVNLMSDELAGYRFIRPAWLAHGIARALDWFIPIFPNHVTAVSPELKDWFVDHGVRGRESRHGASRHRAGDVR